jgi:hypothetical protein
MLTKPRIAKTMCIVAFTTWFQGPLGYHPGGPHSPAQTKLRQD